MKGVNDRFGHPGGNDALLHVAEAVKSAKRNEDVAARWGGDEFAVLLEGADVEAAMRVADRILYFLNQRPARIGRHSVAVTVTIGVATSSEQQPAVHLFADADRALYSGKKAGRNRIVFAG